MLKHQTLERQLHAAKLDAESARTVADRAHAEALETRTRVQAQLADMLAEVSKEKEATAAARRECSTLGLEVQMQQQSAVEAKAQAEQSALQLTKERASKDALVAQHDKRCRELEEKVHSAAVRQQQCEVQLEYATRDKEAEAAARDAAVRAQRESEEKLTAALTSLRRELVETKGTCQRAESEAVAAAQELVRAQEAVAKWRCECEEERVSAARVREELEARSRGFETEAVRLKGEVSRTVEVLDLKKGEALSLQDQIFVDTKFEFGYVTDGSGQRKLIYMDEVGTPDSSRIWDGAAYAAGSVVENSKEGFRKMLQAHFPDADILLNKDRMDQRYALARDNELPVEMMDAVSKTYVDIAEKITGKPLPVSADPRAEIIAVLRDELDVIESN